jgi:hypothetical protein
MRSLLVVKNVWYVTTALLPAMLPVVRQCSMQLEVCDLAELHNFSCAQTLKMLLLKKRAY